MVIRDADRAVAVRMFQVAVGLVAAREEIPLAEYAYDAMRLPNASTIRALIAAGRGRDWLPSVIDALAEVGIAAAEEVLCADHCESEPFRGRADVLALREVIGRMRGGITIHDVNNLEVADDWWDVISGWVGEQRGRK